jgi:hypothetical protein
VGIDTLLARKELDPLSRSQLIAFQRQLQGIDPPLAATRHFPDSDYTVHHRKGFSCDVRTWSSRTENAECVNQENTLGAHLADGASYILVHGDEYLNIFPTWDWRKIPGVLARQENSIAPVCHYEGLGSQSFVGGLEVADREWAVVGMDFAHGPLSKVDCKNFGGIGAGSTICCMNTCGTCGGPRCGSKPGSGGATGCCTGVIGKGNRTCSPSVGAPCKITASSRGHSDNKERLTAKRSWFLVEEGLVSLTAGVSLQSADQSIAVTLQQSILHGTVQSYAWDNSSGFGSQKPVPRGNSSFALGGGGALLSHRNVSYVVLNSFFPPGTHGAVATTTPILRASVGTQSGSWRTISGESSNSTVNNEVFSLWLDLGSAPISGGAAGYAVFPGSNAAQANAVLSRFHVVANTVERQVAMMSGTDGSKTVMAVVHTGSVVMTAVEAGLFGYPKMYVQTNGSLLLALNIIEDGSSITFSFSRPVAGGGTIRLTVQGLSATLKTNSSGDSAATCTSSADGKDTLVDLNFPHALGRTAVGSCVSVTTPEVVQVASKSDDESSHAVDAEPACCVPDGSYVCEGPCFVNGELLNFTERDVLRSFGPGGIFVNNTITNLKTGTIAHLPIHIVVLYELFE